jgi:hypothetical protein
MAYHTEQPPPDFAATSDASGEIEIPTDSNSMAKRENRTDSNKVAQLED